MIEKKLSVVEKTIRLLDILQESNYCYSSREIQKELKISDRQVRNYISTLRMCGIDIKSESSAGGGYLCQDRYYRIPYSVTEREFDSLNNAKNFFDSNNVLSDLDSFNSLFHKIKQNSVKSTFLDISSIHYKFLEKQREEDEDQKTIRMTVEKAIEKKQKIRIIYSGNFDTFSEIRVIHPYSLILYKNAYYIEAFCEKANALRNFKIARVEDAVFIPEFFKIEKEMLVDIEKKKGHGLFSDKQYTLKAIFTKPFNKYIQEIVIGDDYKTDIISEDKTLLTVSLDNWRETLTWLHSFSQYVEVIEPKEMRQAIINDLKKNIDIYKSSGTDSSNPKVK